MSVEGAAAEWNCPACTYKNGAAVFQCEMCGTPKPGAPLGYPGGDDDDDGDYIDEGGDLDGDDGDYDDEEPGTPTLMPAVVIVRPEDVDRLTQMGFTREQATAALQANGGSVDAALEALLSGAE